MKPKFLRKLHKPLRDQAQACPSGCQHLLLVHRLPELRQPTPFHMQVKLWVVVLSQDGHAPASSPENWYFILQHGASGALVPL